MQAGFRKNRSTVDQLAKLHNAAYQSIHNKEYTRAVFLDFSKAFDMVWLDGLLLKLRNFKLFGNIYYAIKGIIKDRTIKVRLKNELSDSYQIENGVPQGSVLAPILFLIFINDFPTLDTNTASSSIFADDCTIWQSGRRLDKISDKLNNHLKEINRWSKDWGLKINVAKTVDIIFTNKRPKATPILYLNKKPIKSVQEHKFLGMIFDKHLNWKSHIDHIIQKTTSAINLLRSLSSQRWGATKTCLLKIYTTLIKSKILYGSELLFSANKTSLKKLNSIQNKCFKIICRAIKGTSLLAMQNELGQLPLNLEYKKQLFRHMARSQLTSGNPASSCLVDNWKNHYGNYKHDPIFIQTQPILDTITQLNYKPIYSKTPFWRFTNPNIDTFLTNLIQKTPDSNSNIQLSIALNYLQIYNQYTHLYTDGSKQQNGNVGYGVYCAKENINLQTPLHNSHSIFEAELLAIQQALSIIISIPKNEQKQNFVIFTDSLSVIKSLENFIQHTNDALISQTMELINKIDTQNKTVILCWIPSHIGIQGNDKADKLANLASNLSSNDINLIPTINIQSIYSHINEIILNLWQTHYDTAKEAIHYKSIEPKVSLHLKYHSKNVCKDRIITRLRLGRIALNGYLFKIKKHPNGHCDHCPNVTENIKHFLLDCKHFNITKDIDNPSIPSILTHELHIQEIYNKIQCLKRNL
jgi:ribonuclease HI